MNLKTSQQRRLQFVAWALAGIFVAGVAYYPIGMWTGAIITAWFVSTQKAGRGLLLMMGFAFILHVLPVWRGVLNTGIAFLGWTTLALLIGRSAVFLPPPYNRAPPRISGDAVSAALGHCGSGAWTQVAS